MGWGENQLYTSESLMVYISLSYILIIFCINAAATFIYPVKVKGSERCAELVNLDLHHGEGVDFNCLSYRSWLVMGRVGLYIYLCNGT